MKMFFKRSFGELTKFLGNCIPKFSSKTGKKKLDFDSVLKFGHNNSQTKKTWSHACALN